MRRVEQVVTLQIARTSREGLCAGLERGDRRIRVRKIPLGVQRAQLELAAIHIAHPIDGIEDLGARRLGCPRRRILEATHRLIESFPHDHTERRTAECARRVRDINDHDIATVGDVTQIELHGER